MIKLENVSRKLSLTYKILYLLYVFMGINSFLYQQNIIKYCTIFIIGLGGILILIRTIYGIHHYAFINIIFLIAFGISYVISAVVNIRYGVTGNINGFVWFVLQITLLYICDKEQSLNEFKREVHILFSTVIIWTVISNLIGIVMILQGKGGLYKFPNGRSAYYGMIEGRLWGTYIDPNHGAMITAVALILCCYFIMNYKDVWKRALFILCLIINILYIVFSDSRTGLVSGIAGLCCFSFLNIWYLKKAGSLSTVSRILLGVLVAILISTIFYLGCKTIKISYNEMISEQRVEKNSIEEKKKEYQQIGREQDIEADISNRRFDIWLSGVEIFSRNKIVGITFRNIVDYTKENLPRTYIVNNDMRNFNSFHNMIVDVLVSQGILGIVSLLGFLIATLKHVFSELFRLPKEMRQLGVILFSSVAILALGALFISAIFYANTPHTVMFWGFLGFLAVLCLKSHKASQK